MERKQASTLFLLVVAGILLYLCFLIIQPFLGPFFLAVMMAIVCRPLNSFIMAHVHRPNVAPLISTILVIFLLIAPALGLAILVEKEVTGIFQSLEKSTGGEAGLESALTKTLEKLDKWAGNRINLSDFNLQAELTPWIKKISHPVVSMGKDSLSNVFVFITNTVVTFFTLFYLFRGDRSLRHNLAMILPLNSNQVERLITGIDNSIIANIHGCVAVAVAQGVLTGLAFLVLGIPDPILWGIVTGVLSMLPVIGSAAVWGPAAVLMFVNGSWLKGMALLIWGAVVVAQIDNVVRPYIVSKRSAMHPLAVFVSLMGGVAVFGVLGLFLGPVIVSVTIVVFQMLKEGNLSVSPS